MATVAANRERFRCNPRLNRNRSAAGGVQNPLHSVPAVDMRNAHPWILLVPLSVVSFATIEAVVLSLKGRYDWRAYFTSCGDLALRIAMGLLPLGLAAGALLTLWEHRWFTIPMNSAGSWLVLIVLQDFCYYWMHRADHRVRWLWATHSVHHSPETLNLSAAFRLGWTTRLSAAPIFFAPLVLLGFAPQVVAAALAANLSYQFWLHAAWLPKLGPLEWFLNTPTHHRVHHASNPEYLDANFGGVFIVFDRWFGTFAAEDPRIEIRYGLVDRIESDNPITIGLNEWRKIARDIARSRSLEEVVRAAFGPP